VAYPVVLRRAAGVLLLAVAWGTVAALVLAVVAEGTAALMLMLVVGTFLLPTLVALPPLIRVGRDLRAARHEGDRLLFWCLLYCVGPAVLGFAQPLLWAPVGVVVLAALLYAAGTHSRYDPPG
jgi:hypothetical protein